MDKCILLQFAKFSKGFKISDFDEFVESIGVENLDFLGRLSYPNQWQLRLTNTKIRDRLIQLGKTRIKNRSCWIYPLNEQEIRGFVHWLPISVTTTQLEEHLTLYGTVLFTESQTRTIKFRDIESNPIYFGLMLPHGTVKEMLPHFLKINGHLCLIVIRGRKPACFHCKEVGHFRINCLKYKEKLDSYCNRDPNTAPVRLKSRGRRHLENKNEVKNKTGIYDNLSGTDAVLSEYEITVDEGTTEQSPIESPISEIQVEISNGTEKEFVETDKRTKSGIAISTSSFSETETLGLVETLEHLRQKTLEDFQVSLKSFEKKFAEKFIPCIKNQINNRELFCDKVDISTSIERSGGDSNIDTETEVERDDSLNMVQGQNIAQTPENLFKKTENMGMDIESFESLEIGSNSASDTESFETPMIERVLQTAKEIIDSSYKIIEQLEKNKIASETLSKESITDTSQQDIEDKMQCKLAMLEQAKDIALEYVAKVKEEINRLSIKLINDQAHTDTKLIDDQILKLNKLEKYTEASEITIESSIEGETSPKIGASTKSTETLKQLEQETIETVDPFDKESRVITEGETIEKESTSDKNKKETIHTDSYPAPILTGILKTTGISQSDKECEMEAMDKTTFYANKEFEACISKTTQANVDELHRNIRQGFASILAKGELRPATEMALRQLESNISEMVEEMKNKKIINE